jgi:hypothetical protein
MEFAICTALKLKLEFPSPVCTFKKQIEIEVRIAVHWFRATRIIKLLFCLFQVC